MNAFQGSFAIVGNRFYWRNRATLHFGILFWLRILMTQRKKTRSQKKSAGKTSPAPAETKASESLTVFWTVTVLTVLVTNVMTIAAHYYLVANPEAEKMALLKGLLLFTGAMVGGVSLIVLPILYRVRKVPPPPGLAVFGACVAIAPILAVFVRALGD